ncbi:hypothetical protein CH063_15433, partial [Colletotrichum higginsianum]
YTTYLPTYYVRARKNGHKNGHTNGHQKEQQGCWAQSVRRWHTPPALHLHLPLPLRLQRQPYPLVQNQQGEAAAGVSQSLPANFDFWNPTWRRPGKDSPWTTGHLPPTAESSKPLSQKLPFMLSMHVPPPTSSCRRAQTLEWSPWACGPPPGMQASDTPSHRVTRYDSVHPITSHPVPLTGMP